MINKRSAKRYRIEFKNKLFSLYFRRYGIINIG